MDSPLALSQDERAALKTSLELYLTDLRRETAGTENHAMQHSLARRQELLEGILRRL